MQQGYSGYPCQSFFGPARQVVDERYVWLPADGKSPYYRITKQTFFAPGHSFDDIIVGQSLDPDAAKAIWRLCIIDK